MPPAISDKRSETQWTVESVRRFLKFQPTYVFHFLSTARLIHLCTDIAFIENIPRGVFYAATRITIEGIGELVKRGSSFGGCRVRNHAWKIAI